MWSEGRRSSALDRAQALLSARRNRGGDAESTGRPAVKTARSTGPVRGALKTRSAPLHTHDFLSDLSDLSSSSSAADNGAGVLDSPANMIQGLGVESFKDPNTQSSIGEGIRFLKKNMPPAATNGTTISKSQMPESSSSHKDSQEKAPETRPDMGVVSQTSSSQSFKAQFSSEPSLREKRFIKTKAALTVDSSSATSLKTDEEKMMNRLLGKSVSFKKSLLPHERPSAMRTSGKIMSKKSPTVSSTPCLAAVHPSSSCSSQCGSPSNLVASAQAHLSPFVLSPLPPPPCVSSTPPIGSPSRAGSPQSSLSSLLDYNEALSLDELFVAGPGSEDSHNEMSLSTSEDFRINILTLDDLEPATAGLTDETQTEGESKNSKHRAIVPASLNGYQQLSGLEEVKEEQQEEDVLDYQSDFESKSRTEADYNASQVLECLVGDTEEEEDVSEVGEEAQESHGKTDDDYSSRFSDIRCSSATRTSNRSPTLFSRIRVPRASASHASQSSCSLPSRQLGRGVQRKEAAVQTHPHPLAQAWSAGEPAIGIPKLAPEVRQKYVDPSPIATYVNAETVEALRAYNPAMFALNEMLRQQLALTRQFIERSRYLHFCLVESMGHPDYKYTNLEETMQHIRKHRAPKLTMEKALEEVQQEMRDHYV
ncbi:uncharacterized protein C19orf44 homolog isoform X2 [Genypterus blacodes]|uniref:uncharacterized protein C19orf44 homolog isoform X2 n=1 Tax=Genypterus blacodes TaxID=154954 RepID=UPI003F765ACE